MQSDGGLAPTNRFSGHRAVLSGPAGGYVGYALTTKWHGYNAEKLQLIGFDMGGTSTDVSRFAGSYEHVFEATLAGQPPLQLIVLVHTSCTAVCVFAFSWVTTHLLGLGGGGVIRGGRGRVGQCSNCTHTHHPHSPGPTLYFICDLCQASQGQFSTMSSFCPICMHDVS